MSLLADATQPLLVSSVLQVQGPCQGLALQDLIVARRAPYGLSYSTQQEVLLDFRESSAIASATASDTSRLAAAALQSLTNLSDELSGDKNALPWGLIRLYYAAFYSAHAVLRLLGRSFCYLESRHTAHLINLGAVTGNPAPFQITAGMYRCKVTQAFTTLSLAKLSASSMGGSHESFWTYFEAQLREVEDSVLNGPLSRGDSQAVVAKLTEFRKLIAHGATFGWLSKIRNEIQYRQSHQVWFPCAIDRQDRRALGRVVAQWKSDPMTITLSVPVADVLSRFVLACIFPISCCGTLLARVHERSASARRSFVRCGPAAYLNANAR